MTPPEGFQDGIAVSRVIEAITAEIAPGCHHVLMVLSPAQLGGLRRFGTDLLLPEDLELVFGPGSAIALLPRARIDMAIGLARQPGIVLCVPSALLTAPGSGGMSLKRAKAEGSSVIVVNGAEEALIFARSAPARQIVYVATGNEPTAADTARSVLRASHEGIGNFSVLSNIVPAAATLGAVIDEAAGKVLPADGFILPVEATAVVGDAPFRRLAEEAGRPVVIAGNGIADTLQAVLMCLRQLNEGRAALEHQLPDIGQLQAQEDSRTLIAGVFTLRDSFMLRGLGSCRSGGFRLNDAYASFDAEQRFSLTDRAAPDHPLCECARLQIGLVSPVECSLLGTACTPTAPQGVCMALAEGACRVELERQETLAPSRRDAAE